MMALVSTWQPLWSLDGRTEPRCLLRVQCGRGVLVLDSQTWLGWTRGDRGVPTVLVVRAWQCWWHVGGTEPVYLCCSHDGCRQQKGGPGEPREAVLSPNCPWWAPYRHAIGLIAIIAGHDELSGEQPDKSFDNGGQPHVIPGNSGHPQMVPVILDWSDDHEWLWWDKDPVDCWHHDHMKISWSPISSNWGQLRMIPGGVGWQWINLQGKMDSCSWTMLTASLGLYGW